MQKILIYYPGDLKKISGTPLWIKKIADNLSKNNKEIHVIATGAPEERNFNFYPLKTRFKKHPFDTLAALIKIKEIYKLTKKINPDIIYTFTTHSLFPIILIKKLTKIPVLVEIHGLWFEEAAFKYKWFPSKGPTFFLSKLIDKYLVNQTDYQISVTKNINEYYKKNMTVIPIGVEREKFNKVAPSKEILKIKGDKKAVIYAGNCNKYQGIDLLLDAIRELKKINNKDLIFLIIGNEHDSEYTEKSKDISDYVIFLGKKPPTEIPSLITAADILIIPRLDTNIAKYSFAGKIVEYLATGNPIIATNVGVAPEILGKIENCIIVEPDKESIIKAIIKAKKLKPLKIISYLEKYTLDYSIEERLKLLNSIKK